MSEKPAESAPLSEREPVASAGHLIVCPECQFGFVDPRSDDGTYTCPRGECGHRWEAVTKTLQQIHLPDRRKAFPELRVLAGAPLVTLGLREGEAIIARPGQPSRRTSTRSRRPAG
jgi:hypothetical protein